MLDSENKDYKTSITIMLEVLKDNIFKEVS